MSDSEADLPQGCYLLGGVFHDDDRGKMGDIFRNTWNLPETPVQWTVVENRANSFRGMQVHIERYDFLSVVSGEMEIGLHDLRSGSSSAGRALKIIMHGENPQLLFIPPGVGHGFYAPQRSIYVLGFSNQYDPADEIGFSWDDTELAIPWSFDAPLLSEKDQSCGTMAEAKRKLCQMLR